MTTYVDFVFTVIFAYIDCLQKHDASCFVPFLLDSRIEKEEFFTNKSVPVSASGTIH